MSREPHASIGRPELRRHDPAIGGGGIRHGVIAIQEVPREHEVASVMSAEERNVDEHEHEERGDTSKSDAESRAREFPSHSSTVAADPTAPSQRLSQQRPVLGDANGTAPCNESGVRVPLVVYPPHPTHVVEPVLAARGGGHPRPLPRGWSQAFIETLRNDHIPGHDLAGFDAWNAAGIPSAS